VEDLYIRLVEQLRVIAVEAFGWRSVAFTAEHTRPLGEFTQMRRRVVVEVMSSLVEG
jgi:hypothetical protein